MTNGFLKWTSHCLVVSFPISKHVLIRLDTWIFNASGESHTFQIAAASGSIVALVGNNSTSQQHTLRNGFLVRGSGLEQLGPMAQVWSSNIEKHLPNPDSRRTP